MIAAPIVISEIEHIEQVADCRHIDGNIGIVIVGTRIGQVIAAAAGELAETPVAFHKFHERGMLVIDVADLTALREWRHGDHRDAGTGAEEVDRLDEARVVISATFVDGNEDRSGFP